MGAAPTFAGSVPKVYHHVLGPLIFEPYARDMAARLAPRAGERVLELACGTGIVTRAILDAMARDGGGTLTATDLSQGMIDVGVGSVGADPRLSWRTADACNVPLGDGSFDAVACQFGVMFFPDKEKAMREARRVLRPGGRYVFNVWASLEHNPIPGAVHEALGVMMAPNPPTFLARLPYGYHDVRELERVTRAGGFSTFEATPVDFACVAPSAEGAARAFLEGTPVLGELAERGVADPSALRGRVAEVLAERFGARPCRSTMRAIVCTAS